MRRAVPAGTCDVVRDWAACLVSHSGMVETPRLQAKPLGGLRYDPRMKGYRKSSHTTYQLNYHFVFIPKYRKPVLRGDVALRLRELIREICATHHIEILKGHVRPEHVHLLLSVPPRLSPSRVMQAIKGKTSHKLMRDFRAIRKKFWGSAPVGARLFCSDERKRDR